MSTLEIGVVKMRKLTPKQRLQTHGRGMVSFQLGPMLAKEIELHAVKHGMGPKMFLKETIRIIAENNMWANILDDDYPVMEQTA